MGSECNDIPDQPAPVVLRNSGETIDDHVVVCCDLGEAVADALSTQALEDCVVAPMRRYGAIRLAVAGCELFFEFAGADSQIYSSARAALEVAARLRNHSAATRRRQRVRIGIACHRQVGPNGAAPRDSMIHRAREASRLARDSEIIAEQSLAVALATEASWSALARPGAGTQFGTLHGMCDGTSRMLQVRRQKRIVIGRDAELKRVQKIADAVFAGQGQVVGMVGRPGAGKTFLLSTIADSWIRAGGIGFISRCKPSTQRQPLYPVFSCLLGLAGMHGNEDQATRSERIMVALQKLGGSPEQLAVLEEVVRGEHGDHVPWHLITEWLATVFEKQTRHSPMLHIFEDVRFADSATLRFLSTFAQIAHRSRVLVIASYRAARSLGNLRRSLHAEILLSPLCAGDIERLACLHTPAQTLDPELTAYLHTHSGGAPGRLIELVAHMGSRGLLATRGERLSMVPGSQDCAASLVNELAEQTPAMGTSAVSRAGRARIPSLRGHLQRSEAGGTSDSFARRPTSRTR